MQYRRLGQSGLQLSALSFGAWATFGSRIGRGEARELVAAAWDHGINFFDNAEGYAHGDAERIMGDVSVMVVLHSAPLSSSPGDAAVVGRIGSICGPDDAVGIGTS